MEVHTHIAQEILNLKEYIREVGQDYVNNSALYIIEALLTVTSFLLRDCKPLLPRK